MPHGVPTLRILAHRACLSGPRTVEENTLPAIDDAIARGFGVEFDVNLDGDRLTLAHDPHPWAPNRDAATFLCEPGDALHALNVKRVDAVDATLTAIEAAGTGDRFFHFDFELSGGDRDLMRRVRQRGHAVAHRLSEREPYFERYLADDGVEILWLDEWEDEWLTEAHVRALAEAGKSTYYVSPELHGRGEPEALARRWAEVASWGVTGICTDYPLRLRALIGGDR